MDDWSRLARRARRAPLFDYAGLEAARLDRARIEALLPHRGRMLLLDRIIGVDPAAGRIAGARRLAAEDPAFEGHFPGAPVYPGALLMEMSGQLGLCLPSLCAAAEAGRPAPVRLVRVREAAFCAEARPGDALTVLAESLDDNGYTFVALGQVLRGETVLSVSVFEAVRGGFDA